MGIRFAKTNGLQGSATALSTVNNDELDTHKSVKRVDPMCLLTSIKYTFKKFMETQNVTLFGNWSFAGVI